MKDLTIELNGSGGHMTVEHGCSCGPARYGLLLEIETNIPSSGPRDGIYRIGGVMGRKDMKKFRDLIDAELAKPIPPGR